MARIQTSFNYSDYLHPVPLGPYLMPTKYRVKVDDPAFRAVFTMSVVMEGGRPVCDRVEAERREGGPPIRGADLRVPLDGFLRHTALEVAWRAVKGHKGQWRPLSDADVADFYRTYVGAERAARARRKPDSPERLVKVAGLYRAAVAEGESPAARIAAEFTVSKEHARKLVKQARDAKLLGPAVRGRAGEEGTR